MKASYMYKLSILENELISEVGVNTSPYVIAVKSFISLLRKNYSRDRYANFLFIVIVAMLVISYFYLDKYGMFLIFISSIPIVFYYAHLLLLLRMKNNLFSLKYKKFDLVKKYLRQENKLIYVSYVMFFFLFILFTAFINFILSFTILLPIIIYQVNQDKTLKKIKSYVEPL